MRKHWHTVVPTSSKPNQICFWPDLDCGLPAWGDLEGLRLIRETGLKIKITV